MIHNPDDIGLILCAEKEHEEIELLRLDKNGIRVAEYMTELPPQPSKRETQHLLQVVERDLRDAQIPALSLDRMFATAYSAVLQAGRAILATRRRPFSYSFFLRVIHFPSILMIVL